MPHYKYVIRVSIPHCIYSSKYHIVLHNVYNYNLLIKNNNLKLENWIQLYIYI
jgi:hypothetical protein